MEISHYACCNDDERQIKNCIGGECSDISCGKDDSCVILAGNTTDAAGVQNLCQYNDNHAIVLTNYMHDPTAPPQPPSGPCFAPNTKASMKCGGEKLMKDLEIGEEIMSDDEGGVTKFVGWLQKESEGEADYLQITTTGGDQLTMTGSHIVFYFHRNISTSIFARNLVPGDVLVGKHGKGKIIHKIESVTMTGSLSPLTQSGTIMANNIYSSCYSSFPHQLAHLAMAPARLFPGLFLDNEDTLHQDGLRTYVATMKWIGRALGLGQKDEKKDKDGIMKSGEVLFSEESVLPYEQYCQLIQK